MPDQPSADQPTADQPPAGQPSADQPPAGQPVADLSSAEQVSTEQPPAEQVSTGQPPAGQVSAGRSAEQPAAGGVDATKSGLAPEDLSASAATAVAAPAGEGQPGGPGAGLPEGPSDDEPGHGAPRRLSTSLVVGALGVVFGDIGTSPLYALKTVFTIDDGAVEPTTDDVYGVISLMFWSITIVVSLKYVTVVMRADNEGEGGVMALIALVRRILGEVRSRTRVVVALGILGAALFYGDTLITPAISVLSAVEGVQIAAPGLSSLVLPIAAVILTLLFAVQRFGTGRVGALFGPVMVAWFALLGLAGLNQVVRHPHVLVGLLPTHAVSFVVAHPYIAFIAIGAIVLVITGAEALYADMGHFGRRPIAWAWFLAVLPALTLNYLGQAALILEDPSSTANPFLLLVPGWARIPVVVLATAATVIASQAVISGAFSVTRQAIQLGFLPTLTVRQTSRHEGGQVYLPAVNAGLFVGVLTLMLVFRSSEKLATAYGIAVTGALLIDTVLLLVLARVGWGWSWPKLALAGTVFGGLETLYLSGNLAKVLHGGWLPLLIALGVFTVMTTWQRGRQIVVRNRTGLEGPLQAFVDELHEHPVPRVPGVAVFPHPGKETAPLALRANVRHNGVLHATVVVVSARPANVPVVPPERRVRMDDLGYDDDGIFHLALSYGFSEVPDIPAALEQAVREGLLPADTDLGDASYFLSRATLRHTAAPGMARWRKLLFIAVAHNAANPSEYFGLPGDQTVVMGTHVDV